MGILHQCINIRVLYRCTSKVTICFYFCMHLGAYAHVYRSICDVIDVTFPLGFDGYDISTLKNILMMMKFLTFY